MTPPRRQPPFERAGLAVLVAVVLLVTAAKLAIVLSGPDYDGDAYAHAMAGRRMLLTPGDVAIHWVWLPLLHVLHAAATAAGGGLTTIRVLNTLLSSASAFLLAWSLRDHARRAPESGAGESGEAESGAGESGAAPSAGAPVSPSIVPWLAGALLALDPLSLWLGVTGQTEPLFQLLVLGVCVLCERRAFVAAGALFAAAALTRYEAWPLLAAGLWLAARDRPLRLRTQALWLLPAAAVTGWCLFHFRATGEPLQFLRLNSEFVDGYLRGVGYPWGRSPILPLMAVFYVTVVPLWNMLGPAHLLALAAFSRATRAQPPSSRALPPSTRVLPRAFRALPPAFLLFQTALLAIVTLGFLRRTHLGLPRHAVAFAPLFCALVAVGTETLAHRIALRFPRFSPDTLPRRLAFALLALVLLTRTAPGTLSLRRATTAAFTEQASAAQALRDLSAPGEPILCDDGKIEVLSALAPDRFTRWQVPDFAPEHLVLLTRRTGTALVISTPARAAHLPGGRPLWTNGHLTLLRYEAPSP